MLLLKGKTTQEGDALSINFMSLTGGYNNPDNTTGWGAPNPTLLQVTSWEIQINKRGSTTIYTINSPVGLPTDDPEFEYNIPYTLFGGTSGQKIVPGVYHIKYAVTANSIPYNFECDVLLDAKIQCCLENISLGFSTPAIPVRGEKVDTACADSEFLKFNAAKALLRSAQADVTCVNPRLDSADEKILYLIAYCDCNCTACD